MGSAQDLYNLATQEALEHAEHGRWDDAIQWGKKVPMSWDVWQQMPQHGMPDEAIHAVMDHLGKTDHDRQSSFHHELAQNLPKDIKPETLNRLARHGADDYLISDAVHAHPNFQPDVQMKHEEAAANFWNDYERKVKPEHFAAIKSMQTNRPERVKFHRETGDEAPREGSSEAHMPLLPHLRNHAAMVQEAVKQDPDLRDHISYKKGETGEYEPHVRVFRGVNGDYAKAIHDAAKFDPTTHTVENKHLKVPSAPFASWTTDIQTAGNFAGFNTDTSENKGKKDLRRGAILQADIPLKHLIHSGFHHVTPLQVHAHPSERELVFQHPEGHYKVKAKDVFFPKKGTGSFEPAKTRKKQQPVGEPKSAAKPQPVSKFELDGYEVTLADLTGITWGKPLAKAIDPEHIQHFARQHEPKGPQTVDAKAHEQMHPPTINIDVERYRNKAVHAPSNIDQGPHMSEGMTAKAMFKMPRDENGQAHSFMLKPYHEKTVHPNTNLANWNQHPIAGGWAEMANQGLYHAGGIGHLHQKVHTDADVDHGDAGKHPVLVHHMARGYSPVHEAQIAGNITAQDKKDAKKMQLMDFLGNNLDRHSMNLLHRKDAGLLAIDSGRNFQYKTASRMSPTPDLTDRIANYNATGNDFSAFKSVDALQAKREPEEHEKDWDEAFDWWKKNGAAIGKEFQRHLALIKDPAIKEHLLRNFTTRTAHLDQLAEHRSPGWQSRGVPVHPFRPGKKQS